MVERSDLADDEIDAAPVKALFVEMLTRDIGISRAVIDLIDNSVDGARRLRPGVDESLEGLEIFVDLDAQRFQIKDNCGGIGIELARRYAFRIGRAKGMQETPNSVGQFGVGMKRALFKFGRYFEVTSSTQTDKFVLKVDVDAWEADETSWKFKFDSVETELSNSLEKTGTEITVQKLRPSIASSFGDKNFRNNLGREITAAQQQYINRGLRIVFDGRTLIATPWQLLRGHGLEPAKLEETIVSDSEEPIYLRIFAGISDSSPSKAGWYVFCNGRMVLEADQSSKTGWSALAESQAVAIPKYHNQFARFRGYVFFDCRDAARLPWNTTKTGVDEDSSLYRSTVLKMIETMRPIINFLNQLDAEKDSDEGEKPLASAVTLAAAVDLRSISRAGIFEQPDKPAPTGPAMTTISYKKPKDDVDALMDALNTRSARDTGIVSFDLAYKEYVGEA